MAGPTGVPGQFRLKEDLPVSSPATTHWRLAAHWGCNVILALLWGKFALNAYAQWAHTGSLMLLGLVLYNTLLVAVTIARRLSVSTSTQIKDWLAAVLTVGLSMMFRPTEWRQWFAQAAGSILQGIGLIIMTVALWNLGKSFGIVAANRGIKRSGLYGWVRHPLYGGELIFFTGFLLTTFSPYNLIVWFGVLFGLIVRSWVEEDHLRQDPEYQGYMKAVPHRFFPKPFY